MANNTTSVQKDVVYTSAVILSDQEYDYLLTKNKPIVFPRSMLIEVEVADFFKSARKYRQPYLSYESLCKLDIIKGVEKGKTMALFQRAKYQEELLTYKNVALAHLCLPLSHHLLLRKTGINTIDQLYTTLQKGKLRRLVGIGPKTGNRIEYLFRMWTTIPHKVIEGTYLSTEYYIKYYFDPET